MMAQEALTVTSIRDSRWVRKTFMLGNGSNYGDDKNSIRKQYRYAHQGVRKFTDTRLGGNFSINPPPQFTSIADPPVGALLAGRRAVKDPKTGEVKMLALDEKNAKYTTGGQGHYYSEAIDDNGQYITMRMGVPEYNGMLTFFTGFFDAQANLMAAEGRVDSGFFFTLGQIAGLYGLVRLWPLALVIGVGRAYKYLTRTPTSKYYYMRESMGLYWNRVNTIANAIGTNMQIIQRVHMPLVDGDESTQRENVSKEYLNKLQELAPDIFIGADGIFSRGGVDVFAMATRVQRKAIRWRRIMEEEFANGVDPLGPASVYAPGGDFDKAADRLKMRYYNEIVNVSEADVSLMTYLKWYKKGQGGNIANAYSLTEEQAEQVRAAAVASAGGSNDAATVATPAAEQALENLKNLENARVNKLKLRPGMRKSDNAQPIYGSGNKDKEGNEISLGRSQKWENDGLGYFNGVSDKGDIDVGIIGKILGADTWDNLKAEIQEGSQWVQFRVDSTGSISESFSNSTGQSDIQNKMNSTSSQSRSARFSFSEGNTGFAPLDAIMGSVSSFMSGALQSVQLSGLMALAGSAFVDIPEVYQSSSTQFPTMNITIKLRSPYGNRLSQFQNLYIPLSMLLAAALPMSTGQQSYTHPFLIEMYCKGRQAIRLGIIDQMTITRGVGNLGWNQNNEALGIDVSFSIKDLSTIMHAPIDDMGGIVPPWSGILADDSAFNDYMGVLGSLSLADSVYPTRKLSLAVTRKLAELGKYGRNSYWVNYAANTNVGRFFSAISRDPDISVNF